MKLPLATKMGLPLIIRIIYTEKESNFVQEFLQSSDIDPLNTRVLKISPTQYKVLICSKKHSTKKFEYKNVRFELVYGDFSNTMGNMITYLEKCLPCVANNHQEQMIQKYIEHFLNGDVHAHKDSQRAWIKDKNPVIETNIGHIEVYLDPAKVRGEFEGFVAAVDKEASKKLADLVNNAESLISHLTWPKEFEIDKFSKPRLHVS